jgi:5'-3' exonuclease
MVCQQYIDGFDWVLKCVDHCAARCLPTGTNTFDLLIRYYLRGVPAWHWFFPFHFAPLASDFIAVSAALRPPTPFAIRGTPLPPLHQLLAVTPPKSRMLLPPAFRSAMQLPKNVALFPSSVELDMNGCSEAQAHKAVALVPFMDMSALARLFDECAADLDPGSRSRNEFGRVLIFTARGHSHGLLGIAEAPTATSHPGVVCHAA